MSKLKKLIVKLTSNDKNYEKKLAVIAGCSVGTMNKFKNDESREFADFIGLINIIKEVADQTSYNFKELVADYTKTIDVNRVTARYMLEYLSVNRLLNDMDNLLKRMEAASNKESKEWVSVYKLLYKWQTEYDSMNKDEFLRDIREISITDKALNICKDLLKCNVYYSKMNYKYVSETSKEIELKLETLEDSYVKTTYKVKMSEIHSVINLWVNKDYGCAREYAKRVLDHNIGETFNGQAFYVIGCSYFYDSYEKSLEYLEKSSEVYESIGRKKASDLAKARIQLLNCYWDKSLSTDSFIVPSLFFAINKGQDITTQLEDNKASIEKPFYYFLKGLNDNDKDVLLLAMIEFLKEGNAFNANLPKQKLIKEGFNEDVLESLLKIHCS